MKQIKSFFRGTIIVLVSLFILFVSYYFIFRKEEFFSLKGTPIKKKSTKTLVAFLPNSSGVAQKNIVKELKRRDVFFDELVKLNRSIPLTNPQIENLKQYITDEQAEQLIRMRPELKSVTYSSSGGGPKK
jgi:hypothetical protein